MELSEEIIDKIARNICVDDILKYIEEHQEDYNAFVEQEQKEENSKENEVK